MKNLKTALAAGLFVASPLANATTVTFNDLAWDGTTYDDCRCDYRPVNPIDSLGFHFSNDVTNTTGLGVWAESSPKQADTVGHAAVFNTMGWTATTMTSPKPGVPNGFNVFDFYSIDLADVNNNSPGYVTGLQTIRFTFSYATGASSSQDAVIDTRPGLQTFVFDKRGLLSVSWVSPMSIAGNNGSYQFDNVSTVPESTTSALLLAGLGLLLGVFVRRRKPRVAA